MVIVDQIENDGDKTGDSSFNAPNFSAVVDIQLHASIMATDAITTSVYGMATSPSDSSSQVRVQLKTQHPDIALPENAGPILVNTSNVILELFGSIPINNLARLPAICPFHACQHSVAVREADSIRISH